MKSQSNFKRPSFVLVVIVAVFLVVFEIFINWQDSPWGQASALKTANAFMMNLSKAEHVAAFEKLAPEVQRHLSLKDFNYPVAQPITWQLNEIDRHAVVTGHATFADGVQLPVEIRLGWRSLEWKIYGAKFGRLEDSQPGKPETLPRLGFLFCCDPGLIDKMFARSRGD